MINGVHDNIAGITFPFLSRVEYIENTTSGEYIDTEFTVDYTNCHNVEITMDFQLLTEEQNDTKLFGSYSGMGFATYKGCLRTLHGVGWKETSYKTDIYRHILTMTKNKTSLDNINIPTWPSWRSFDRTGNIFLFRLMNYASDFSGKPKLQTFTRFKMYSMHILYGGSKILDMIPVRFINENHEMEGGMYDRISNTIFRNIGSGKFIIGPDLK